VLQASVRGEAETDVPCGDCTACCRSAQFVLVEPDEADARAHIPAALLFPAPRLPQGNLLMGYDQLGRCPMLGEHGCTIYEHRPRTCRTYDCRVFPAAGVFPDEPAKTDIASRARRWVFTHSETDRALHDEVIAAAQDLRVAEPDLPATPLAVRAAVSVRIPPTPR
jgi:Fe-S-cluster containining protein